MPEYMEIDIEQIQINSNLQYHLFDPIANKDLPIMMPVLVYNNSHNYILVDGFKRYKSFLKAEKSKIPALISDKDSLIGAFVEGLNLNNLNTQISIAGQFTVLKILNNYFKLSFQEIEEISDNFFQIPIRKKFSGLYERFFNLDLQTIYHLHILKPSFKQMQQLLAYPKELLSQICELSEILPLKIKDALFFLDQMFRLEKTKTSKNGFDQIKEIMENPPFPNLTADKKSDLLKLELQKKTFPDIYENRRVIQKLSRELMGEGFHIKYDNYLEKSDMTISFQLKNFEELRSVKEKLSNNVIENKIFNILNVLKNG